MKRLVYTGNLSKKEWLRYRKMGIGGSDAAAVCGLNPYLTAIQVYLDKTSENIEDIDNEAMRQGRDLEDYVAQRFMEATGKKVRRCNWMFQDEQYPFMLADVDRLVVGENAGLECKTATPYMQEHWEDNKIPIHYLLQCHHYIGVYGADAWYIAVIIYGREFKYYRIERDEEILAALRQIEKKFWENHVEKRILPDPDGSKTADSVIAEYFKKVSKEVLQLNGFDEKLRRRQDLVRLMKKMENEKRQIEQELKVFMGEAQKAENEHFRVSWTAVTSDTLDEKRLKEEKPEVYQAYVKQSTNRRFSVKAA